MRISRDILKALRSEIDATLKEVGKKYSINLKAGNATFSDTNFTFKLEGAVITANGTILKKESEDFKRNAILYGLKPEDLGRRFQDNGRAFEITGLKPKASRYPILAKNLSTGQTFKFTSSHVKRCLGNMILLDHQTVPAPQVDMSKIPESLRYLLK